MNEAIGLCPHDPRLYVKRSIVYRQMGDFDSAATELALAVQAAGGVYPDAQHQFCLTLNEIALRLLEEKRYNDAVLHLNKAILGNSSVPELFMNRGDAYRLQGKLDVAKADYTSALALNPESTETKMKLSLIHAEVGRALFNRAEYDEARVEMTSAIENNPRVSVFYEMRADAATMAGDHAAAYADLTEAVVLDPMNDKALDKLYALSPNGLPARAAQAVAFRNPLAGKKARPAPARRDPASEEARIKEAAKLSEFVRIKRRAEAEMEHLFSERPQFSAGRITTTMENMMNLSSNDKAAEEKRKIEAKHGVRVADLPSEDAGPQPSPRHTTKL